MKRNNRTFNFKINLDEYTKYWELNNYSYIWHDLFVYSVYENRLIENIVGVQEDNLLCICENGKYSFYLQHEEIKKKKNEVLSFFSSSAYTSLVSRIEQRIIDTNNMNWVNCYSDWKLLFKELCDIHTDTASLYFCTEAYYVDNLYEYLIKLGYAESDIIQYTVLQKMPTFIKEQLEWYDLIIDNGNINKASMSIEEHLSKWQYIVAKTRMNPYTIDDLYLRYKKDRENIELIKNSHFEITQRYLPENIENLINKSKDIFKNDHYALVRRISEISYIRLELRRAWMKTGYLLRTLIQELFPNDESIFERSAYEILEGDIYNPNERKSFVYFLNSHNSYLFYNGTQKLIDRNIDDNSTVMGKISLGRDISGTAYILENNKRMSDALDFVNNETILVLSQLCPEHVPLLSICKGIVVDEGGIAGHACIIAREMKKPAILGTINGTQRIQNGEYISLDIRTNTIKRNNYV